MNLLALSTRPTLALGALLLCLTSQTACPAARVCGEGTVLEGELCVSAQNDAQVECGEGTVLENGRCVLAEDPLDPRDSGTLIRCGAGTILVDQRCVLPDAGAPICEPDCLGRSCGSDGCGGTCGACNDAALPLCDEIIGQCTAICVPQCTAKNCGDDQCGGVCGICANAETCTNTGKCLPESWTCDARYYGGGEVCDCACGAYDPDCEAGRPLAGCNDSERCNTQGECVPEIPASWTCASTLYDARDACNCGCGAYDPDCDFGIDVFTVEGCGTGVTTCSPQGECGTCTPDCTGKTCGDDGCGGSCGSCDFENDKVCLNNSCLDRCGITPARCLVQECGDDGCGGTCGSCAAGSTCSDGECIQDPVEQTPFSCYNRCGSSAPSGCYCTENCVENNNCCTDFAEQCACTPDCNGKACGSDGCGGSCGTCGNPQPFCTDVGQCTDQCTPQCDGKTCGDDGCGGSCGTCATGASCFWTSQCVPDAWTCDGILFSDGQGCDCGCGAFDPDCTTSDAAVFGCPSSARTCTEQGLCDISFCTDNAACGDAWCTGAYLSGPQEIAGFCAAPTALGEPPGYPCVIDEECASGLCVGEQCRLHCQDDTACPAFGTCVGLPRRDLVTQVVQGYVGVCETLPGSAQECAAQADCSNSETCIALMNPQTQSPRWVCAAINDVSALGRACDFEACPAGYRCEEKNGVAMCALPCPAGAADCPVGYVCEDRPFAPLLLQNNTSLAVCLLESP